MGWLRRAASGLMGILNPVRGSKTRRVEVDSDGWVFAAEAATASDGQAES